MQRARSEPVANEVTLDRMNDCVVSAYLLTSQLASIRFYERRMASGVAADMLNEADLHKLDLTRERVLALLAAPGAQALAGEQSAGVTDIADEADLAEASPASMQISVLLARRLRYIEQEAAVLAALARPALVTP